MNVDTAICQMLENEMAMNADNLKSIVAQGNEMARAGHFDSAGILKAVKEFDQRYV
jgi:spectrin beta